MSSIRKVNTRPELALRQALRSRGIRGYRLHVRSLPGNPDVVFIGLRVAVFVDGVWWHGHPDWLPHGRRGPYWDKKIAGNADRDRRVDKQLAKLRWRVVRLWDVEVLADPTGAAKRIEIVLQNARVGDSRAVTSRP
jgi:DNA mismatch endonuclease (patch repair protein)